jgi:hypothetical protein
MVPFLTNPKETQARLVTRGGQETIVAAYMDSVQPTLWHMNLVNVSDLSLLVREEEGAWVLGYVVKDKPFAAIAQFVTRDEADAAFQVTRAALMRSVRHHPALSINLRGIVVVLLILFFGGYLLSGGAKKVADIGNSVATVSEAARARAPHAVSEPPTSGDPAARLESGEPVAADDVLKPPAE